MYCVRCGAEADRLHEHLCLECYAGSRAFVEIPTDLILHSCRRCGRFEVLEKWKERELARAIEDRVMQDVLVENGVELRDYTLDITQKSPTHYSVELALLLDVEGAALERHGKIRVRHRKTTCPVCQRIAGNYYEAIIQVRGADNRISRTELESITDHINSKVRAAALTAPSVFLTKMEDMHGGRDFYLGSRSFAHRLARELVKTYGAEYKESSSLWGMKEGKELHRMTYLVRLPPYRGGDFFQMNSRVYRILSFGTDRVSCVDLDVWAAMTFKKDEMRKAKVLGGEEMVKTAVLVSENGSEIQVMNPNTYITVDMKKPAGFVPSDSVYVIDHDDRLYLVPSVVPPEGPGH